MCCLGSLSVLKFWYHNLISICNLGQRCFEWQNPKGWFIYCHAHSLMVHIRFGNLCCVLDMWWDTIRITQIKHKHDTNYKTNYKTCGKQVQKIVCKFVLHATWLTWLIKINCVTRIKHEYLFAKNKKEYMFTSNMSKHEHMFRTRMTRYTSNPNDMLNTPNYEYTFIKFYRYELI